MKLYSELCNFLFHWRLTHKDTKGTDNFEKEKKRKSLVKEDMFYILAGIMLTYKLKIAHYNYSFSPDSCLIFTSTDIFIYSHNYHQSIILENYYVFIRELSLCKLTL